MDIKYITRTTSIAVVPESQPLFSEQATKISITDEGGGEYITITQSGYTDENKISLEANEWPTIKEGIEKLLTEIETHEKHS